MLFVLFSNQSKMKWYGILRQRFQNHFLSTVENTHVLVSTGDAL